jgi:hypothetical protein
MGHKLQMVFEELCAIYLPEKAEKKFCATVVFEYNKEKGAVILSIDHNAALVAEEELLSDISFVIVRRLADELEQSAVTDASGVEHYRMTLTIREGGGKQNEN